MTCEDCTQLRLKLQKAEVQVRELRAAVLAGRTAVECAMKIFNNPGAPLAFTAHYGPKFNAACKELEAKLKACAAVGVMLMVTLLVGCVRVAPTWNGDRRTVCDGADAGLVLAGDAIFQCGPHP